MESARVRLTPAENGDPCRRWHAGHVMYAMLGALGALGAKFVQNAEIGVNERMKERDALRSLVVGPSIIYLQAYQCIERFHEWTGHSL